MPNKKTNIKKNVKKDESIGGLVVVAIILVVAIIIVTLNGNHKDYSNIQENTETVQEAKENLYIGEIEIGNSTVIKANIYLYKSDKVSKISNGDKISLLTNEQLDFSGTVNLVGDEVKEINPGDKVSGVLVQLDSLVNLAQGTEINIMQDDVQIGTLKVEEVI